MAINPAIQVAIVDAYNNTVTNNNSVAVTLGILSNPGSATLTGGGPVTTANGIASFPALQLSQPGVGYTLIASATGFTSLTSPSFTISP